MLDGNAADGLQQRRLVCGAHHFLIALAGQAQGAVDISQLVLRPLAVGNVAEIPYPAKVLSAFAEHRSRITVKRSAIFQGNLIPAGFILVRVELFQLSDKFFGSYQFIHHRLQHLLIGFGFGYVQRHTPQVNEPPVEGYYFAVFIHHEDSVKGGFLLRGENDVFKFQSLLRLLALLQQVPFVQGVGDGMRHVGEGLRGFHHVFQRARLDCFHRHLLVAIARHHQNGELSRLRRIGQHLGGAAIRQV